MLLFMSNSKDVFSWRFYSDRYHFDPQTMVPGTQATVPGTQKPRCLAPKSKVPNKVPGTKMGSQRRF